jgi:hypothetical protein
VEAKKNHPNAFSNQNSDQFGMAANQDFVTGAARIKSAINMGWDPYEVWKRMIKEPRDRLLVLKEI